MKFLYLTWSNLKRKKLRTTLTVLSILVAFVLYGFLAAIKNAFGGGVNMADADRLMTRHKVSIIQSLPFSYKAKIAGIPGVVGAAHLSWFGGIYQDPKNFFATFAVEPEDYLRMYPEILLPEDQKKAWLQKRTGAIIGRSLADRFQFKVGDRIPLKSPIWRREGGNDAWEFDVVGIYDAGKKNMDTRALIFRYDYFDESRGFGKGQVGWFGVRIKDPNRAAEIAKQIDAEFENSPFETKSEPEGAMAKGFAQQIGDIGKIMMAIMSAVFFTILLVAGNTMAQSVRERTEELGVLKAMGFTNELVLGLVIFESCIIAFLGGALGLGLALLIMSRGSPAPNIFPVFNMPVRDLGWGVALVVVLGLITGLFPAIQAMRLKIAEALRRQA
jgi:putative ABC transport system permease protein